MFVDFDIENILKTNEKTELDMNFNTLTIQQCGSYTLHRYDITNFTENKFSTSVATYAFTKQTTNLYSTRTTDWFPSKEGDGELKKY